MIIYGRISSSLLKQFWYENVGRQEKIYFVEGKQVDIKCMMETMINIKGFQGAQKYY